MTELPSRRRFTRYPVISLGAEFLVMGYLMRRNVVAYAAAELLAAPVDSARISNQAGDLTVTFGVGCKLELFNDSAGYESWILNGVGGEYLVAQGGGQTVERRRPDV
jgi:hypothetical protein